jgi:hypothetical protein
MSVTSNPRNQKAINTCRSTYPCNWAANRQGPDPPSALQRGTEAVQSVEQPADQQPITDGHGA